MIETLITILIVIVVVVVLIYIARLVVSALGLPAPIGAIVMAVIGLIAFLYIISLLGLGAGLKL